MGANVPDTRMTRDEVVARLRALKWTDDHWHTENCGTCATLDAAIRLLSAPSFREPAAAPVPADCRAALDALGSIARNTCCGGCGEAARVAQAALDGRWIVSEREWEGVDDNPPAAAPVPDGARVAAILAFLEGAGPSPDEGAWFGDASPYERRGNFWWRRYLPELRALLSQSAAQQDALRDTVRLDWLLMDMQPDGIGGYDIWDWVDGDCDEEEVWSRYLAAARRAIDAVRAALADTEDRHE